MRSAQDVIDFWFVQSSPDDWFGGKAEFDDRLRAQFEETHAAVGRGEAWHWRQTPEGRLAEIIVLDQFSRQLHRNSAMAFAYDGMALVLAQEMVALSLDQKFEQKQLGFAYMPYMHSESEKVHKEAVRLFTQMNDEYMLKFEIEHQDLIKQFGRYPKRNQVLGRTSTQAELAYIEGRGDSFF